MRQIILIILLIILTLSVHGQCVNPLDTRNQSASFHYFDVIGDSAILCKGVCNSWMVIPIPPLRIKEHSVPSKDIIELSAKIPDLVIHGNILYNANYRSYLDTPFAQKDLLQQSIQTYATVTFKDRYPVTLLVTHRRSNSPYFLNSTDINIRYNRQQLLEKIKSGLREDLDASVDRSIFSDPAAKYAGVKMPAYDKAEGKKIMNVFTKQMKEQLQHRYDSLYERYASLRNKTTELEGKLKRVDMAQLAIEQREAAYLLKKKAKEKMSNAAQDSVAAIKKMFAGKQSNDDMEDAPALPDTAAIAGKMKEYEATAQKLAVIKKQVQDAEKNIRRFQQKVNDSLLQLKRAISQIKDNQSLEEYTRQHPVNEERINGTQKALLSVEHIGIGKTWVDYSDLTVSNIYLTGIDIAANPGKLYVAAATGKVNYQFRDFVLKNNQFSQGQYLNLVRAGYGRKEGNHVIVTMYTGKKSIPQTTSANDSNAVKPITGVSVETRVNIDKNNYLLAEVARSSYDNMFSGTQGHQTSLSKVFDFSTHANEGWSVKLLGKYPQTNTAYKGYYRKTGEAFQSFTLYTTGTNQTAWMAQVDQLFWKKRIAVQASIRKNDFNGTIASPDITNGTVFKSIQVSMKVPKYPFVMVGYYPVSQLVAGADKTLYEGHFNTLNAVVSHSYRLLHLNMNTNVVYTKFYNKGSDSSFLYYNATSYSMNQNIYLGAFTIQGNAAVTDQAGMSLTTLEAGLGYRWKNLLTLSGSLKRSRLNHAETLFGAGAGMGIVLKRIGTIQLQYDKSYLPTYNRSLLPVDIGRLTYVREF